MFTKTPGTNKRRMAFYASRVVQLLFLSAIISLSGCGGGSALPSPSSPPSSPQATLTSVQISPLDPTIAAGTTQQFFVTATYSDNSTKDVTNSSSWTSSDSNSATIESKGQASPGLATGIKLGSATIVGTFSGMNSSTLLTITSAGGNGDKLPLMDMLPSQTYLSFLGGLYENVSNIPPADHDTAGLTAAYKVQPLDPNGNPNPSGKLVFVSIGRSSEQDEFNVFVQLAGAGSTVNHNSLVIANGALTGILPCAWAVAAGPPSCAPTLGNQFDRVRDTVLAPLGVTEQQVQIAWIEEYNADPASDGFQTLCDPTAAGCTNTLSHTEALRYENQLGAILRAAKTRWPNLQQVFHSSRVFSGYATNGHDPEPYAYEYGFSVKWLIEAQICQLRTTSNANCANIGQVDPLAGDLNYNNGIAPWMAWGAYLWANGSMPRADGLIWCNGQAGAPCNNETDYESDGTHLNLTGDRKAANLLLNYFLNSPYSPWFRP